VIAGADALDVFVDAASAARPPFWRLGAAAATAERG
jgi:hypothetical protein